MVPDECAACGNVTTLKCSRCKSVRYCSPKCQTSDWNSGHKLRCKVKVEKKKKSSFSEIALCLESKPSLIAPTQVLFPYQEFVQYFNGVDGPSLLASLLAPRGLNNCGNSCFANVVLQCLTWTRPLVAHLVERGHKKTCKRRRNNWCFFCEFETHLERVKQLRFSISPTDIISKLPDIGGNFGDGRQEDAHELMRFAIDMMQSACLDEFGGEKMVPPRAQETTLIQYIFGGLLQSQVECTVCSNMSVRYENMMDLTVEIHGDAVESLEECLEQYTAIEWLDGDNKYKCDRCNDYVKACKRLSIRGAPNILTIALKRFQSGFFGKLNKEISFPETLELGPYMSSGGSEGSDVYKLYAVIVHLNRYNASFSGHYICYVKSFLGFWYKINDSKVERVELEEVLSQSAYMLLYTRVQTRPSRLLRSEEDDKNTSVSLLCNGIIPHSKHRKETSTSSLELSLTVFKKGKEIEERMNKESNPCIDMEHERQQVTGDEKEDKVVVVKSEANPCTDMEVDCGTDAQEEGAKGKEEPRIEHVPVDSSSCSDTTTSCDVLNEAYSSLMNGPYSSSRKRGFSHQSRWL